MSSQRITVLIDLPSEQRFRAATLAALEHAIAQRGADVAIDVVPTDRVGAVGDGVVIGPGSPYRDAAAAERVIARARVDGTPLVAT
jgi:hypothetical protein